MRRRRKIVETISAVEEEVDVDWVTDLLEWVTSSEESDDSSEFVMLGREVDVEWVTSSEESDDSSELVMLD